MKYSSPYYIFAPPSCHALTSAGVRVMYDLCDKMIQKGFEVYVVLKPSLDKRHIPRVTNKIINQHFEQQRQPIVIYPETIFENPLSAEFYVRYMLCYNDYFGSDLSNDKADLTYFYSKALVFGDLDPNNILFIPVVNRSIFHMLPDKKKRSGSCYAALKYKYYFGQKTFGLPDNCLEITRGLPNSQTTKKVANIFRSRKYFYCFDNSALALEATLCGCVAILMPNPYLQSIIGKDELYGCAGVAWGDSKQEVLKAKETVHLAEENYNKSIKLSNKHVDDFITKTQLQVKAKPYTQKVHLQLKDSFCYSGDTRSSLFFHLLRPFYRGLIKLPFLGGVIYKFKCTVLPVKKAGH